MSDDEKKASVPSSAASGGGGGSDAAAPPPPVAKAAGGGGDDGIRDSANNNGNNSKRSRGGGGQKSPWQRKREQKRRKFERKFDKEESSGDGDQKPQFRSRKNDALALKRGDPKGMNRGQPRNQRGGFRRGNFRKGEGGWEDDGNQKPANAGSFAHPEMRKLFGVKVVGFDDDDKEDEGMKKDDTNDEKGVKKDGATKEEEDDAAVKEEATASTEAASLSEAKLASAAEMKKGEGDGDKPAPAASSPAAAPAPTGPKRKVAILLAFLGTSYQGMQINASTRTIQAEIELALYRSGLLAKSNFGYPHKYGWSNSARTDKGVHSCAQVCSVKITLPKGDSTMDEVRELMNAHLPDDIRALDVVRVTKSFCARTQRDRVRYRYMIPSYALRDRTEVGEAFEKAGCDNFEGRQPGDPLASDDLDKIRTELDVTEYRIPENRLSQYREALAKYCGTRAYHNYTARKSPNDPSVMRYIETFEADDPVIDNNGVEWIPTSVLGQSFLLHQIRKMIAMAAEVASGSTAPEDMDESFSKEVIRNIHVAPASGLFLEMSYFGNYNDRQSRTGTEVPPLDWTSDAAQSSDAVKRWREFRDDVVERHVMEEEDTAGNFIKYLYIMKYYFSPEGGSFDGTAGGKRTRGEDKDDGVDEKEEGGGDGDGGGDGKRGKDGGDGGKDAKADNGKEVAKKEDDQGSGVEEASGN